MAISPSYIILACIFCLLHGSLTSATTPHHDNHHDPTSTTPLKSMHFSVYQQDTLNKTAFLIVNGVGNGSVTATISPIGSIFVARDPVTATQDPSSEVVGYAEGASVTSGFDGLDNLSIKKVTFVAFKGHNGSVSILGSTTIGKASALPVVGGTDDFLLVQGIMIMSLADLKGNSGSYKLEFHLYWPPYAAQVINY